MKMKLTLRRFSWLLGFQFAFLIGDLFINTFGSYWMYNSFKWTVFFIFIQELFILAEYALFTLGIHMTCAFKVGAVHIILEKCKLFILCLMTYFVLTGFQHYWTIYNWLTDKKQGNGVNALVVLHIVQRLVSFFYYYATKRAALFIADPRYEEANIDWIASQLSDINRD